MRFFPAAVVVLLASPAWADMFQDASNAKLPDAQVNLGIQQLLDAAKVLTPSSLKPFNAIGAEAVFTGVISGTSLTASGITTLLGGAIELNSLLTDKTGKLKLGTIVTGGAGPYTVAPSQAVSSELMSSLPQNWRAASLTTYDNPGVPATQEAAVAITGVYTGGQVNGPSLSQSPLILSSVKRDYWSSTKTGEIDGLWSFCRQGRSGDSACGLFDSASVNDPTIVNFGRTSTEMHGTLYNTDMTVNLQSGVLTNYMVTGNPPYAVGVMVEAEHGVVHDGVLITTKDGTTSLVNAIGVSQSRTTSGYAWKVSGAGDQFTSSLVIGATNGWSMTANPAVLSVPAAGVNAMLQSGSGTGNLILAAGGSVNFGSIGNGTNWGQIAAAGMHVIGGLEVGTVTGGVPGAGFINVGGYQANGVVGVSCAGAPTAAFAAQFGIVTHC